MGSPSVEKESICRGDPISAWLLQKRCGTWVRSHPVHLIKTLEREGNKWNLRKVMPLPMVSPLEKP